MCTAVDPLTEFIALIPFRDRQTATTHIAKLRASLTDQIDSSGSISDAHLSIKSLKAIFTHLPLTLRRSLKQKILDAFEQTLESSKTLSLFTILLIIIELNCLRNSDRSDLETSDIVENLPRLNSLIERITKSHQSKNSNLLYLQAWVVGSLVYTYRQCILWCAQQDCIDLTETSLEDRVPVGEFIYSSPSVPKLLKTVLDSQRNRTPPPIPKDNYTLNDLVLLSAFSGSTENLLKHFPPGVPLKFLENHIDSTCAALKVTAPSKINSVCKPLPPVEELHAILSSGDLEKIQEHLQLVERHILDNASRVNDFKQVVKECIQSAPSVMLFAASKVNDSEESTDESRSMYASFLCCFLRVWIHALEKRLVFEDMPQSYLYLCAFMNIKFQQLGLKDFVQSISVVCQFLTSYGRVFKWNILHSPHWFLQLLSDCVVAIIDRLVSAEDEEDLTALEYAVCPCIAAVGRTWASLHAEEPEARQELSRAIKPLLDTIAVQIAAATVPDLSISAAKRKKWASDYANKKTKTPLGETTALRFRVRQMLNEGLVFPLLDVIDPWALQQSLVGLKPPEACEVLRNLVLAHEERRKGESGAVRSNGPIVMAPAAVSGLSGTRLKAKALAKRNRGMRKQKKTDRES